jgi:hypothetical protein
MFIADVAEKVFIQITFSVTNAVNEAVIGTCHL